MFTMPRKPAPPILPGHDRYGAPALEGSSGAALRPGDPASSPKRSRRKRRSPIAYKHGDVLCLPLATGGSAVVVVESVSHAFARGRLLLEGESDVRPHLVRVWLPPHAPARRIASCKTPLDLGSLDVSALVLACRSVGSRLLAELESEVEERRRLREQEFPPERAWTEGDGEQPNTPELSDYVDAEEHVLPSVDEEPEVLEEEHPEDLDLEDDATTDTNAPDSGDERGQA